MIRESRKNYLKAIRARYLQASKKEKGLILNEFCAVCGYNRKYAIAIIQHEWVRRKKLVQRRGPKPRYQASGIVQALKEVWLAADQPCSKRLKAMLPTWIPFCQTILNEETKTKLLAISPASIDRLLKEYRRTPPRKGFCTTKPGRLLKQQIPIKCDQWGVDRPGFMEADTVAHCGESLAGEFIWSMTLTDIYSGWTENRALFGKGSMGVIEQIQDIEARLPFALLGFDSDNGSEFLNHHLWRYFAKRQNPVGFTRSRPYHKNDNAHVEQKNWSCVRRLLGYERLEHPAMLPLINLVYRNEWALLNNFFYPAMKLKVKERVGSQYHKQYEKPQTPYMRLMQSEHVPEVTKVLLKAQFESLNPFALQARIQAQLKQIFKLTKVRFKCEATNRPFG